MVMQALLIIPFELAWIPFMLSVAKRDDAKQIYSSVLTYFLLIGVFIALALSVLSREVIAIMATPPFHDAYKVVPLIAFSYLLFGCYLILQAGIYIEGKTKYVPLIVGAGAVLNLGLNYLLIPSYGMMGAATATLLSYLLLPVAMLFVAGKYYPIRYEFDRIIKIVLAAVPIYVGCMFVSTGSLLIEGLIKLIILATYPALLYVLRLPKPQELEKIKQLFHQAPRYIAVKLGRG